MRVLGKLILLAGALVVARFLLAVPVSRRFEIEAGNAGYALGQAVGSLIADPVVFLGGVGLIVIAILYKLRLRQ